MMTRDFNTQLDEALELVRQGASTETVVRAFPDAAELIGVAQRLQILAPTPALSLADGRRRFLNEAARLDARRVSTVNLFGRWLSRSAFAALAIALLVLVVGATITLAAGGVFPILAPAPTATITPTAVPTSSPTPQATLTPEPSITPEPSQTPVLTKRLSTPLAPAMLPTDKPTMAPTMTPSAMPAMMPTAMPTAMPSMAPTRQATMMPTHQPTMMPTRRPAMQPTTMSTRHPTMPHP
ncbi:MAG: hypothetical protein HY741_23145 [Chloroflexi bacterium]|nr:hypothetical protein [Chloroflexota bacterium]